MTEKPLVSRKYKLERFQAKGGWTYITIPQVAIAKLVPVGWRRVKGFIDDYEFRNYHLMPMGNGRFILPVKAEIRRQIGKKEGDTVTVTLFKDDSPLQIPKELQLCLADDPGAYEKFMKLGEGYQKEFINWIYTSKKTETRVSRIAATIKVLQGKTLSKG